MELIKYPIYHAKQKIIYLRLEEGRSFIES